MKLANHTDIATTSRYAHVLDDDLLQGMILAESRNSPEPRGDDEMKNDGFLRGRG